MISTADIILIRDDASRSKPRDNLDGTIFEQERGYWIKVEAKRVEGSEDAPLGIRYSLTLHNRFGTRGLFHGSGPRYQRGTGMKSIVIGVMPQKQIRARMIAIAKGKYKPKAGEPKIWFTSMRSVAEVLSDQNRALLKVIRETNPGSVAMLAKITGRQPSNLSRTLRTMSRYGLVDLRREKTHLRPVVKATDFRILATA